MNIKKKALPIRLPHDEVLASITEPLLTWYEGQSTLRCLPWREEVTPYHTWLSEIMLQQTRASAVIPTTRASSRHCPTSRASRAATTNSS